MRTAVLLRLAAAAVAVSTAACGSSEPAVPASAAPATESPAPATPPSGVAAAAAADANTVSGVVAETMNSGGYTYARLTASGTETWIAGTEFPVKVGDTLTGAVDMPMADFHSRTLNRDFKQIYFVREVALNGKPLTGGAAATAPAGSSMPALAGSHDSASPTAAAPAASGAPAPAATLIAKVAPAPGGVTVADVRAKQAALAGKPVVIRGQIVKANYEIMGTNWYHLQDGSGKVADGSHDLMVTSDAQAKAGDVVTVSGVLTTGKDFGAGYAYDVIIEKAAIKP